MWKYYKEIDNVMTPERCQELIDLSESMGYDVAPITTPNGPVMKLDYRNNERVIYFSEEFSQELYGKIKDYVPEFAGFEPLGLNEMFKFYKYKEGNFFNQHRDSYYESPEGNKSHATVLLYLNEGYKGGTTDYQAERLAWKSVIPKIGKVFIFDHKILHKSALQEEGVKYIMRTDIMYKRV